MKIFAVLAIAFLATGCASIGDVEALQAQVSALESSDKALSSEIADLQGKVAACEAKHAACDKHCKALESKLDKVFKKAQYK